MTARIPATVVTGFLGAGKTSLIRHLITHNSNRRLAFLINEFGDLGIDRELLLGCGLPDCGADDVIELANGCICCTVADDFLPAMQGILDRPMPPDHILIETSGLALPKPLVKAFDWPGIRARVQVDGVIAVVDARALADGLFSRNEDAIAAMRAADPALDHDAPLRELFDDQLSCADMVIVNKTDLLTGTEERARVESLLTPHLRPGARLVHTADAAIDPALMFGPAIAGEAGQADAAAHPGPQPDRPDHHHDDHDHHEAHDEHDHDAFESFSLTLGPVRDGAELATRLASVIAAHDILRVKGFLNLPGADRREVIQGVGPRLHRYFDRPWQPGEERRSEIVVIARRGIDRTAVTVALNEG